MRTCRTLQGRRGREGGVVEEQYGQDRPGAAPHLDLWSVLYVECRYWVHQKDIYLRWSEGQGDSDFDLCEDVFDFVSIGVGFVSEYYLQMCLWNWMCLQCC